MIYAQQSILSNRYIVVQLKSTISDNCVYTTCRLRQILCNLGLYVTTMCLDCPKNFTVNDWLGLWYPRSRVRTRPKPSDFSGEKIHSMPSFRGEVKPSAPCHRFPACKKTPAIYVEVGIVGKIDRPFLTHNSVLR
jgi:hypothetical protein